MSLADNNLLTSHSLAGAVKEGVIDEDAMRQAAADVATAFDVRLQNESAGLSAVRGQSAEICRWQGNCQISTGSDRLAAHLGR